MQKENSTVTQLETQDSFWFSIIENCESSIADLKEEICKRRQNINDLETGLNGYLTYHMNQLFRKNPNADITDLYKVDGIDIYKKSCCSLASFKFPDLSSVSSVFTMEGNDLSLMRYINQLTKQEKELLDSIARLREKELALNEAHREVKALVSEASRKNRKAISADLLIDTNERLLSENEALKEELNEVRNEIMEQMKDTQLILIKTIEEQLEINDDLEKQLCNFEADEDGVQHQARKMIDDLNKEVNSKKIEVTEQVDLNQELLRDIKKSMDKLEELKNSIISRRFGEMQC